MTQTPPLSIQILQAYYPVALSLYGYLERIVETNRGLHKLLVHETDSKHYRDLLSTTIVAGLETSIRLKPCDPLGPLRELIERSQRKHLLNKSSVKNILTSGYQLYTKGKNKPSTLLSRSVNTVMTVFQSPAWTTLYNRVGDDILFHLLMDTSMFIALPNSCYCQIVGTPIIELPPPANIAQRDSYSDHPDQSIPRPDLKRKRADSPLDNRPATRRKLNERAAPGAQISSKVDHAQESCRSAADVAISRSRLFYHWRSGDTQASRAISGLPAIHILNRLRVQHGREAAGKELDTRKLEENARHLAKYVFPLQFGMSSAFVAEQVGSLQTPFATNYSNREKEIKTKGPCKTPKRVKLALPLLEKMIWRHHNCGYRSLLLKTCPSKIRSSVKDSLDSSVILEMMSECSIQLPSQRKRADHSVTFDANGQSISIHGLAEAKQQAKQKPRFAEFMCSYNEVYRFAVAITKTVIPMQLWGSVKNFKVLKRHIKNIIEMRRYETFTVHTLMQDFCISDCDWLTLPVPESAKPHKVPISDSLKRLELLQEYMYWYFDSFLIPLLKTAFYVTESQAFRNKVLYFRQDDWDILCRPLVERLCADTFQKVRKEDAEEILRRRALGYSFVRLLPKETGVRPIINLRRRDPGAGPYGRSINQILKAAFHVLTYEKDSQRKLVGASVFSPNEIYKKLKVFKARLQQDYASEELPKLYFVKMDVQACFDTIDQTKLLEILVQILKEDQYIIQRHGEVSSQCGRVKRKFKSTGMPADDYPHFLALASQLADTLRHTIFVDKVVYPDAKRQDIIDLLEQHITDNIVKIGDDYYRQVVGIPQGSILSTLLCSFFYGDLDRNQLKFTEDPHTVLLRLVDDYLLVTSDRQRAQHFINVMNKGHPEYGCFISRDKTLANFDAGEIANIVDAGQRGFPWCGFLIDTKDLSVSTDYTRWSASTLRDSFTVDLGRRPGAAFAQKMLTLARTKSHMIYNDCRLNTTKNVYKNIYQSFCLVAIKMHFYLRSWKPDMTKSSKFITSTVRQVIRYSYASMRTASKSKVSKTYGARLDAQKGPVIWLGTHAFHTVLSRKSHEYACILRSLEFDMRLPQYVRCRKQLKGVVKEGPAMLALLGF